MTDALDIPEFLRRGRMSLVGVRLGTAPIPPASHRARICEACGRRRGPFVARRPLRIWFERQMRLAL